MVHADKMSDAGADAKSKSQELVDKYKGSPTTFSGNTITTPDTVDEKGNVKPGTSVNVNDLFQGSSTNGTTPMSKYFPTDATPDVSQLQTLSDNPTDLKKYSENYKNGLFVDSQKSKPDTIAGDAYKLMVNEHNRVRPNLKNDPVFAQTKAVQGDMENIAKSFSDCKTESVLNKFTTTTHIPDIKYCERVSAPNLSCKLTHNYSASPAVAGGITSGNTTTITLGNETGGDYLNVGGKKCGVFESGSSITVTNPDAITSVKLLNYHTDDYAIVQVATGADPLVDVWTTPWGFYESGQSCPDIKDKYGSADTDITSFFKGATAGESVNFNFRQSVRSGGGGYIQVVVEFDTSKLVTQDSWTPQECIDLANSNIDADDIFEAKGNTTCTSMPATHIDGGGQKCSNVNGAELCEKDLSNPIASGSISSFCQEVKVEATYNHPILQAESDCKELEQNTSCSYKSQKCVEGAIDSKGLCYITEETWDCGKNVAVEDANATTKTQCVGPVRCMGSDCVTSDQTKSTSFAQTAAKLQSVQFMTQDMTCNTIKDAQGNVTGVTGCSVFGGKGYECKVALGGVQNCCNVPTTITAAGYITALMQMSKMNTSLMAVQNGNAVVGAYQTIGKAVGQGVSEVTKPFTSYIENISGSVDSFMQPINVFIDELKQKIKDTITNTIKKMVSSMAQESGASGAAAEAAKQQADKAAEDQAKNIVGQMSSAASTLMAVYAYYVVAMMIIQTVFKCEQPEFELAGKRKAMVCEKAGDYCKTETLGGLGGCIEKRDVYCCYSSPMSRIIHKQVAPQLGLAAQKIDEKHTEPNCSGIPINQVASIDWSQVDLSEWTAILSDNNLMPDAASMALEVLTGTGITGANPEGNALNLISQQGSPNQPSTPRVDAKTRTEERLDGLDIDQARRDADDNTPVNPAGIPK